jgi:hypothetical protein
MTLTIGKGWRERTLRGWLSEVWFELFGTACVCENGRYFPERAVTGFLQFWRYRCSSCKRTFIKMRYFRG